MSSGSLGRALAVTVSDRASSGIYEDRSGPVLVEFLAELGFEVDSCIVADGEPVAEVLRAAIADDIAVVVTTGGTGLGPRDLTPEITGGLIDREIPHLAAAIARVGWDKGVAASVLSRGLCGLAGQTLVINLPGSPGAVKDAREVLSKVLPHAVSQVRGGDHG